MTNPPDEPPKRGFDANKHGQSIAADCGFFRRLRQYVVAIAAQRRGSRLTDEQKGIVEERLSQLNVAQSDGRDTLEP